jgi:hypothetical protein
MDDDGMAGGAAGVGRRELVQLFMLGMGARFQSGWWEGGWGAVCTPGSILLCVRGGSDRHCCWGWSEEL